MANAYECDRCGKLYKEYDDFAPFFQYKGHGIRIMSYEKETDCWPNKIDLCPVCMKEMINALEGITPVTTYKISFQ